MKGILDGAMRALRVGAGILIVLSAGQARADGVQATLSANSFWLQQYLPDAGGSNIVIWSYPPMASSFPGPHACQHLQLGANVSEGQRSRFWALVLAAKAAGKNIRLDYDDNQCEIVAFLADIW